MDRIKMIYRITPDAQFRIPPKRANRLFRTIPILLTSWLLFIIFSITQSVYGLDKSSYITTKKIKGCFPLFASGKSAPLMICSEDDSGVLRAANDLKVDIGKVTNTEPAFYTDTIPKAKQAVLIGTLGKSPLIDQLIKSGQIHVDDIQGKWETFLIQKVDKPFKNIKQALVIAGSDKRGTIYGIYDLSEKIGVSPWYWWADVPPKTKKALYVLPGHHTQGEPAVRYRGIFINDEGWALGPWAEEKFGGFNHKFYVHVFELLLRLKANYLWPGMWGKYFGSDPMNPKLADEYGIVMGSSHCEPLLFNNDRGARLWTAKMGPWNYKTNKENICKVLDETVAARGQYENVYTIGLRGVHDTKMEGDIDIKEQVALLEQVFEDQREILTKYINKDITDIPQIFVPYKEVQDYFDSGLKVPDDVTIVWSDDNWGNIRRLPRPGDKPRVGRGGVYYHYDFHGGPRSYEWLNTSPIPKIWEQMHLAYRHGADRLWVVNVGDIKPMEFPISFFMDYAWNPEELPADCLTEYTRLWADQQFGPKYAADIADILTKYTKYNGRRKPESLAPDTYSLTNYREAETVVADYKKIAEKAEKIYKAIPDEYKDAYYQIVLYPTAACANLNELYVTVGKNRFYAKQGRAATNDMADKVKELFEKDAELTRYYHKEMADGKWNHMMATTHIGYTSWNPPRKNIMPNVNDIELPNDADMGVAIEGSENWWPMEQSEAVLPEFDPYNQQSYYIDIFNRGKTPFTFSIKFGEPWLITTPDAGQVEKEVRVWVRIDWPNAPEGIHRIPISISGPNETTAQITAIVRNPESPKPEEIFGFVESNRYVSVEAEHFTRAIDSETIKWLCIPGLSRTLSGMTPIPVTAQRQTPEGFHPHLEYQMHLFDSGEVEVHAYFSPTQNFLNTQGLRYGISFDNEPVQIINIHVNDTIPDWKYPTTWNEAVMNSIKIMVSKHVIKKPGDHILKFWMVDPGLVLQKLVVDTGGLKPSYLGPPESYYRQVDTDRF